MNVLLTGGAGYIGSHTCVEVLQGGHRVVVLDNLCNARADVLDRVAALAGRRAELVRGDIRDGALVGRVLADGIDAVIHFAGLKAVGESSQKPLDYYDTNVNGTLVLARAMADHGVRTLVFSSSATVYGDPAEVPIPETAPTAAPTNPYGASKAMVEQILRDLHQSDPRWSIGLLRYFNPAGAHPSGTLGEDPVGLPNNLMPYVARVAAGVLPQLQVFGDDYPTPDGTGVRDYLHVVDLARAHVRALEHLRGPSTGRCRTWNLGSGRGHSVLEVVRAFERASGREVPYRVVGRRPGDIAACYADPSLANRELGWSCAHDLDDMCADAWRWQQLAATLPDDGGAP